MRVEVGQGREELLHVLRTIPGVVREEEGEEDE
jgi:hypothetical protein